MVGGPELCRTASWWEGTRYKQQGSKQQEMYTAEQDAVFQP